MELSIGFSPCPNDTFIFDALINGKIDTQGLHFTPALEDVQTLNKWAIDTKMDVSKISYGVLPLVMSQYTLLHSGGALGKGVGPLLIAKNPVLDIEEKIAAMHVAIPGQNTTAHVLFSFAFPEGNNKSFMVFNEIENAVLCNYVDAGVIIHENRFTYQEKGLVQLIDLGHYWESVTNLPIPLGGIVMKNTFSQQLQQQVNILIRNSLSYAFEHYPSLPKFVTENAQEMSEDVMRKHIELYVNDYSLDLGTEGLHAVNRFLQIFDSLNKAKKQG